MRLGKPWFREQHHFNLTRMAEKHRIRKTVLLLEVYNQMNNRFINEIDISHYSLDEINEICPPVDFPDDFEYCDGHFVTKDQFIKLKQKMSELSNLNYEGFIYNIITRSIK
jgi:hypothetical protein